MNPPTISLSDVVFGYHQEGRAARVRSASKPLFQRLSLEIPAGTITTILGPNGSGKTTLLHLILGILVPEDGVVLLARRPRETYSRREMGQLVGLVSQDEYIPFNFTVLEYVVLGRAPHLQLLQTPGVEDISVAEAILGQISLAHLQDRSIQSLSGGERQLVMIARALAQHPRILLLDEPTSHLDLGNREHVLAILRQQAEQGVTVVFTTHEPNQAADVAAFVVLMREGRVLGAGTPEAVLTTAWLTQTYGVTVDVLEVAGRRIIVPSKPMSAALLAR
ncbi:MAG: ABC transporter ATP-binding protein [Anaerolineae bacterium]|nr:ABC transporter ATP-binding protein [Anaerolineae bacterium]